MSSSSPELVDENFSLVRVFCVHHGNLLLEDIVESAARRGNKAAHLRRTTQHEVVNWGKDLIHLGPLHAESHRRQHNSRSCCKNANCVNRSASLGKESLQKLLKQEVSRLIFHRWDPPYEKAAKKIVGYVGWDSAVSKAANSNFKDVLISINAHTKFPVLNPAGMDWVYCGQWAGLLGACSKRMKLHRRLSTWFWKA